MKPSFLAAALALSTLLTMVGAVAANSPVFCGPDERSQYRCGAILVILEEEAAHTIADVIKRMGGDPTTDVLQEFSAVRDLLDPDGVADDVSGATVYQVAVPVGNEHAMARAYGEDPAVYAAAVDRETIGYLTADTALPAPAETSPILLGIGVLLVACAIAIRRSSAARA